MNPQQLRIIFYTCAAAVGGFLFGFDSAVINGTVDALQTAFASTSVGTGFAVVSFLVVLKVVRATKGRTLESM